MRFYAISIGENEPDRLSNLIQEFLSSKHQVDVNWSHSALLVEDAGSLSGVWESTGKGFAQATCAEALKDSQIRHKIELDVPDALGAIGWLKGFRGTAYANAQYLLFAPKWLRMITRWFIPSFLKKWIANGKALSFCSESVAHFIRDNCRGAESDPDLSVEACDHIDPYMVLVPSRKYSVK